MGGSTKLKTRQRLIDMRGSGPTRVCPNAKSATRQSRKQTNAHDDANATWADGVRQHYSQNNMYKKTLKNIAQESPNHPKRPPNRKPKKVPIAISPTTFLGGTQHHRDRLTNGDDMYVFGLVASSNELPFLIHNFVLRFILPSLFMRNSVTWTSPWCSFNFVNAFTHVSP